MPLGDKYVRKRRRELVTGGWKGRLTSVSGFRNRYSSKPVWISSTGSGSDVKLEVVVAEGAPVDLWVSTIAKVAAGAGSVSALSIVTSVGVDGVQPEKLNNTISMMNGNKGILFTGDLDIQGD